MSLETTLADRVLPLATWAVESPYELLSRPAQQLIDDLAPYASNAVALAALCALSKSADEQNGPSLLQAWKKRIEAADGNIALSASMEGLSSPLLQDLATCFIDRIATQKFAGDFTGANTILLDGLKKLRLENPENNFATHALASKLSAIHIIKLESDGPTLKVQTQASRVLLKQYGVEGWRVAAIVGNVIDALVEKQEWQSASSMARSLALYDNKMDSALRWLDIVQNCETVDPAWAKSQFDYAMQPKRAKTKLFHIARARKTLGAPVALDLVEV